MDARRWLRKNKYEDIADMIDEIMVDWRMAGKRTRRNWWDILAGGQNGQPRSVAGTRFPVLKAAQERQGKAITRNSLSRKRREEAPSIVPQNRWEKAKQTEFDVSGCPLNVSEQD